MRSLVLGGLLLSLAISGGLALLASEAPDGLEHSMQRVGARGGEALYAAPMADYEVPWLASPAWRRVVAGASGTLAVFGLALLVGWALRRWRTRRPLANASLGGGR